ncbi:MAG: lactate utilization protein [Oscillospiraceae bacterium]|nr:lactate utilization protein [Oscillospiraceae bacterium]
MDMNVAFTEEKRAERTMEALRSNRMEAYFVKTSEEAVALVKELIPEGSVCRVGGSRTLHETGIISLLENGNYDYRDSHVVPPEEVEEARREAFFADFFLASANAITEDGEIYNVDGAGTRVAPIIFGPKNVILVAGTNKIVTDIAAAEDRLRNLAAPANAKRLGCKTPCAETGTCMNCKSPARICCSYTLLGYQRIPNRIKIIIVGEHLGY